MTAAHTLEEVNNQITQIQQFVQMLEYEARNVASLPFSHPGAVAGIDGAGEQPDEPGAEPRL